MPNGQLKKQERAESRREELLELIDGMWKREARSPTMRELCWTMGTRSTSHISWMLKRLAEEGRLKRFTGGRVRYVPYWVIDLIIEGNEK